jgi:hypothetical protein
MASIARRFTVSSSPPLCLRWPSSSSSFSLHVIFADMPFTPLYFHFAISSPSSFISLLIFVIFAITLRFRFPLLRIASFDISIRQLYYRAFRLNAAFVFLRWMSFLRYFRQPISAFSLFHTRQRRHSSFAGCTAAALSSLSLTPDFSPLPSLQADAATAASMRLLR